MAAAESKVEEKAAAIERLRKDHAEPAAWAKVSELRSRGWTFPGLSRKLNVGGLDVKQPVTVSYYGSPLRSGLACATGATVKELVVSAELWEAEQVRRKPESRTKDVVPTYRWPDHA